MAARFGFLLLHALAVYLCALFFSPRLVSTWFNWIAPMLHLENGVPPADWYLQHLVVITIIPALIVGYVNVRGSYSMAPYAWAIPLLVLAYKLVTYSASGSVLYGTHLSAFEYFFDIQQVMPTFANPLASDPGRVLAQMNTTAPFYAGIAYSLGAIASKLHVLKILFAFRGVKDSE
ncbi:MAG: hypothetical protein WA655_18410 [Candidatus Korobacteraceae bacterium]